MTYPTRAEAVRASSHALVAHACALTLIGAIALSGVSAQTPDRDFGTRGRGEITTQRFSACDGVNFAYVGQWSPPRLTTLCVDTSGALTFLFTIDAPGDARDILSIGNNLYFAYNHLDQYFLFAGIPVHLGTVEVGQGSFHQISTNPAQDKIYGSFSRGEVYVFDDLSLLTVPTIAQVVPGFIDPHGITVTPDNTALFVGNQWSFIGDPPASQEIVATVFDGDGLLIPGAAVNSTWTARPDYFVFHPNLPLFYHTDRPGGALATVAVESMTLTPLDVKFSGFGANRLVMNGAGTRIYIVNTDANTVTVFGVDGAGNTSLLQTVPAGYAPEDLELRADGLFLYVVSSGFFGAPSEVRSFSVDSVSGLLTLIDLDLLPPAAHRIGLANTN